MVGTLAFPGNFKTKPSVSISLEETQVLQPLAMDEVAFVESLFAPEMRPVTSGLLSLPSCGRVKALTAERAVLTPPSTSTCVVPPPPNSLLGGGILGQLQMALQPPQTEDSTLFVRLNDDDMLNQMLSENDFNELQSFKKEQDKLPSSSKSFLLEPLDLPRNTVEQSLKDAFYDHSPSPSMQLASFRTAMTSIGQNTNTFGLEAPMMMPVFPLGAPAPTYFTGTSYATFPATPSWVQDDVSTPGNCNFARVHSMKQMMFMGSSAMSSLQHQPSPASVDMFHHISQSQSSTSGEWITTSPFLNSSEERNRIKLTDQSFDKLRVERPPLSLTISPPASLTSKALKELIVSADITSSPAVSRSKRVRTNSATQSKVKLARVSPINTGRANTKISKGKKCIENGCLRRAQSNSRCKAHGGGARCQYSGTGGCNRSSQGGGFCRAHGGGKRCEFPGCTRGQQRKGRCYVHGGIRKCQYGDCEKKDRGNGFCISHGGGKRCEYHGCTRAVRRGQLCQIHEVQIVSEAELGNVML